MPATLTQPPLQSCDTMSSIRIYNTLSRQKEPFEPVEPGKVGIYLCGPTVYKEAHIGHMVGPVIFDTIKRFLTYCGYDVTWVVNITDVDDKLIAQSRERNISMSQVATEMTMDYCANLLAMGVNQMSSMPRATDYMPDILDQIEALIAKEYDYEVEGDVFFDISKDHRYGKLSNRAAESQQGEGGEAAAKKRSAGDFALWKSAKPGEPSWDSPWGPGRPGWHIECSAMSHRILGDTFDIHGGGLDLIFPHHENEIAQSECRHGKPMANYWLHNGLLRAGDAGKVGGRSDREGGELADANEPVATDKLSRSKGAGGLRGLIERQGGERIRFFLLRTHYRSTVVFSEETIAEEGKSLDRFYQFFNRYQRITDQPFYLQSDDTRKLSIRHETSMPDEKLPDEIPPLRADFLKKMADDFNTGAAMADLFQLLTALNKFADEHHLEDPQPRQRGDVEQFQAGTEVLRELAAILGLFLKPASKTDAGDDNELTDKLMQLLIKMRANARNNKDFATADLIRDALSEADVILEDRKDGTTWSIG